MPQKVANHANLLLCPVGPEPAAVQGKDAVEVNDPVTLTCSAQSVPPASYTWKLNGTLTAVKTAEYVIEKASFKNSGTYTCEAHNAVTGQNSTYSHTLAVKGEPHLRHPLASVQWAWYVRLTCSISNKAATEAAADKQY